MPDLWVPNCWPTTAWKCVKIESGTIASKEREAAVHACMNRAKLGCTLNLRNAEGKELFKQLVAKSNVVVDNFSSGVVERLGFPTKSCSRSIPASSKPSCRVGD